MILRCFGSMILICLLCFAWSAEARLTQTRAMTESGRMPAAKIADGKLDDDDNDDDSESDDDGDDDHDASPSEKNAVQLIQPSSTSQSGGSDDEWIPAALPDSEKTGSSATQAPPKGAYEVVPASAPASEENAGHIQVVQSASKPEGTPTVTMPYASGGLATSNARASEDDAAELGAEQKAPVASGSPPAPKDDSSESAVAAESESGDVHHIPAVSPHSTPVLQASAPTTTKQVTVDNAQIVKLHRDRKNREDIETLLAHNRARQEEIKGKIDKVSDPKFNAETNDLEKKVAEETKSPQTALMMTRLWKEIRKYNVPAYKEYLKQELANLKVEEAKLEDQIGDANAKEADDKAAIDKEEDADSIQVPVDNEQIGGQASAAQIDAAVTTGSEQATQSNFYSLRGFSGLWN